MGLLQEVVVDYMFMDENGVRTKFWRLCRDVVRLNWRHGIRGQEEIEVIYKRAHVPISTLVSAGFSVRFAFEPRPGWLGQIELGQEPDMHVGRHLFEA